MLFGKLASDLQTGVTISGDVISGKLKYVSGYTGFSSKPAEQQGNYIALRVGGVEPSDTVTVELIGGTVGHPITLDSDRNIVLKIANTSQKVKVVVNGDATKTYKLTGLELAVAPDGQTVYDGNGTDGPDTVLDGNGDGNSNVIDGNG